MRPPSRDMLPLDAAGESEPLDHPDYDFGLSRRAFIKSLGAGLFIAVSVPVLPQTQESGQRSRNSFLGSGARNLAARIHLGTDGSITVLAGKVEGGQGARTELSQAAAEELGVPVSRVQMILADTSMVPDDGMTAGSGSTPRTVPAVRRGAATARKLLIDFACAQWRVEQTVVEMRNGRVVHTPSHRSLGYADLAKSAVVATLFEQAIPSDIELTPVKEWKVMGTAVARPNGREIVTGAHLYPSDIARPGMLYGKILRPPAYDAKLLSIDLAPAKAMADVIAVRDSRTINSSASLLRTACMRDRHSQRSPAPRNGRNSSRPARSHPAKTSSSTSNRTQKAERRRIPSWTSSLAQKLCAAPITSPTSSTLRWSRVLRSRSGRATG